MKNIFVVRQDTHVGSYWFSELLQTHNIAVFFQFEGDCSRWRFNNNWHDQRGKKNSSSTAALASWHDKQDNYQHLFASGCACMRSPSVSTPIERMGAYCRGECTGPPDPACQGVAIVGAAWSRAAAFAQTQDSLTVTLERANIAKLAVSHIKDRCGSVGSLANHASAAVKAQARMLLWLEPSLFASVAVLAARNRRRFLDEISRSESPRVAPARTAGMVTHHEPVRPRVAFAAVYEHFRSDPASALRALTSALGLAYTSPPLRTSTVKTGAEDLSRLILNFEALNESIAPSACLHAQLLSRQKNLSDGALTSGGTSCVPPTSVHPAHGVCAIARCALPRLPGESVLVECGGAREQRRCRSPSSGPRPPTATFGECFGDDPATGDRLCALAASHGLPDRSSSMTEPLPTNICVRTLAPSSPLAHVTSESAMASPGVGLPVGGERRAPSAVLSVGSTSASKTHTRVYCPGFVTTLSNSWHVDSWSVAEKLHKGGRESGHHRRAQSCSFLWFGCRYTPVVATRPKRSNWYERFLIECDEFFNFVNSPF
jgi:hypothetical protein